MYKSFIVQCVWEVGWGGLALAVVRHADIISVHALYSVCVCVCGGGGGDGGGMTCFAIC